MDLLKILSSLEEFIFEAITWLVLYPQTLWRIVRHPLATMDYSEREESEPDELRYDEAMSPPLLLLITVVLANLIAVAAHVAPPQASSALMRTLTDSPRYLVLFRCLMFSLVPLVAATTLLRRKRIAIGRRALRAPFHTQCYLATPSAIAISAGGIIVQRQDIPDAIGLAVVALGTIWFLAVQTLWFRRQLTVSWPNAAVTAVWAMLKALVYLILILTPLTLI